MSARQRVVVVTGGGNGIGAAVAAELHRQGWYVVTVDPMVSLDGSEKVAVAATAPTAGDRAVDLSVTDGEGVRALFVSLAEEFGRLDAVINVAGISRPTSYTRGTPEDWRAVLDVHLNGFLNVYYAAMGVMEAVGYGRVLAVTSGSGWRAADAGAYGCAKRAVAAMTWHLGRAPVKDVVLSAISPIAVTRMVTAALGKAPSGTSAATGGLNLGSMPQPEEIGPLAAHLVSDAGASWARGKVVFAGGTETAVVEPPRLLEVVQIDGTASLPHLLAGVTPALVQAEATQTSGGGSNPRFGAAFADSGDVPAAVVAACAVVSDRPAVAAAIRRALEAREVRCVETNELTPDVDAVVVALAGSDDIVSGILDDAAWARAAADAGRPVRLVTLTEGGSYLSRARAQASAQLARSARKATDGRVTHFALTDDGANAAELGEIVAHLVCNADTAGLAGAELEAGPGWFGLRSHPRATASVSLGGTAIPEWFWELMWEL